MAKVKKFFNPAKRSKKFAQELHTGAERSTGVSLTKRQKAFRAGYMQSRTDETGMYNYKKIKSIHSKKFDKAIPKNGAYNSFGRVEENQVDDLSGPVVFWDGEKPF